MKIFKFLSPNYTKYLKNVLNTIKEQDELTQAEIAKINDMYDGDWGNPNLLLKTKVPEKEILLECKVLQGNINDTKS